MTDHWSARLPWETIHHYADAYNLDPNLIGAIIMKESSGRPNTAKVEPMGNSDHPKKYGLMNGIDEMTEITFQFTSWGLMQVLGVTARSLAFTGFLPELCDVDLGIKFGAAQLKRLSGRYGDVKDVIAAYNRGRAEKTAFGTYINFRYVDTVISYLGELKPLKL